MLPCHPGASVRVPQWVALRRVCSVLSLQARSELLSGLSVAYTAQASEGEHVHGRLQQMWPHQPQSLCNAINKPQPPPHPVSVSEPERHVLLLRPATRDLHMPAGVFDVADMQLLLRWLDMLARNPKGTDDVKAVAGVLPPVQKLVLQLLGQLNMVRGACAGRAALLALFISSFSLAGLFCCSDFQQAAWQQV